MQKNINKAVISTGCIVLLLILFVIQVSPCDSKNKKSAGFKMKLTKIKDITLKETDDSLIGECLKIRVDENERIYYWDWPQNTVLVFDQSGSQVRKIGKQGRGPGELNNIRNFDVKNGKICILNNSGYTISIFDTTGNFINSFRLKTNEYLEIVGLCMNLSSDGYIYASVRKYKRSDFIKNYENKETQKNCTLITKYDMDGVPIEFIGALDEKIIDREIGSPAYSGGTAIFVDKKNDLYLTHYRFPKVQKYNSNGSLIETIDMTSPKFIQYYRNEHIGNITKYSTEITWMTDIYFSDVFKKIFILHFNKNLKPKMKKIGKKMIPLTKPRNYSNARYYLNIYDFSTKSVLLDYEITDIVGGMEPCIGYGPDESLYMLSNDQPGNVTISKYKMSFENARR